MGAGQKKGDHKLWVALTRNIAMQQVVWGAVRNMDVLLLLKRHCSL